VKFEESGFRTYEQSESGEFFERWYSVSVPLFSNVRSDKKVFKKIYKKDMEKNVEGIFPGVYHKTSSICQRFRKPSLCVKSEVL